MPNTDPLLTSADIPFDAIVEQAVAGIYVIQDECFVYCNQRWAEMLGYTPEEMHGWHLTKLVPADFLNEVLHKYYLRLKADPPSIEVHGTRIIYRGRPAVMGVGVDVTERLRNEQELKHSREQLQALTAYTNAKLEEQRLVFARDIHDLLGGMLTSIKMDATRVMRRVDTPELQELTRGLIDLTQKTIETVKEISQELRPSELDHLDLATAIRRELREFSERFGVAHSLKADAPTLRLSPRRATAIYRVFHEAMTNVARHADATRVDVQLKTEGNQFVLDLYDDGVGFDSAALAGTSLGLLSMIERSRDIAALLKIDSSPGGGARLTLTVPLL
jgi:two-component system sensor histidine kinase UhpB